MMNARSLLTGFLFLTILQSFDAFSPSKIEKKQGRWHQSALHAKNDWILAGAVIVSFQLAPSAAFAESSSSVDIANGSKLFQANCASCHANGMNFVSEKKTLKKDALEKYRKTTDEASIQDFVQKGMPHRFMPFSNVLSDSDYKDVVSYVLDQALNDKW
jgi:cytochrome c6